jgi:hypothetical protein
MKIMDFYKCQFLQIIPDFSSIPNLEELILYGCTNLVEIHNSVGFLDKLARLSGNRCHNLSSFPRILRLRSLKCLGLGFSKLKDFPEIECQMEYLVQIDFRCTGVKELPSSIQNLVGLKNLYLEGCINLMYLSSSIYQLQHLTQLTLKGCSKLRAILELPPSIKDVDAEGCMSLETIFEGPQRSQLCNTCCLPELSKVISFLDGIRYALSLSLSLSLCLKVFHIRVTGTC